MNNKIVKASLEEIRISNPAVYAVLSEFYNKNSYEPYYMSLSISPDLRTTIQRKPNNPEIIIRGAGIRSDALFPQELIPRHIVVEGLTSKLVFYNTVAAEAEPNIIRLIAGEIEKV